MVVGFSVEIGIAFLIILIGEGTHSRGFFVRFVRFL